ncbi:MAG: type IX secretion system membrane protein PorP/SprF [Cytophagales bacterium]|nr:type IX secretion system membrane protein PorP/SprF [Cytophagales bacterium]
MEKFFKYYIFSILGLVSIVVQAQNQVMFTQYMHNEVVINPAYTGSHDVLSLTAVYREQWLGLDGSPSSQTISGHSPMRYDELAVGGSIIHDQIGATRTLTINNMYSYKLKLSKKVKLHFGLQGGVSYLNTDYSSLNVRDANDQKFDGVNVRKWLPNFGAGLYLYSPTYYFGFSIPELYQNKISLSEEIKLNHQQRHYFFTGGYVFTLSENLKLTPSVFVKYVMGAPVEGDFTLNLIYQDNYWIGGTYRSGDSFDIMLMAQITEQIRVGYAYDYTLTSLRQVSNGTHEIIVNYRFSFSKDRYLTPRYF